jgi:hypothetical protein
MAIARQSHYWNARLGGNDPLNPVGDNNTAWTLNSGSGGAVSGDAWRIANGVWRQTVANDDNDLSIIAGIRYESTPSNGTVLLALDNGTHRVEVQSDGTNTGVKLVGASTATKTDLDITMIEQDAVPLLLRLTLDSTGKAYLYFYEIVEDDNATSHYIETTGSSSSSQGAFFGNASGTVDWFVVYYTSFGAYSPDEMDMSDWTTSTLHQTGFNIVNILKDSRRYYIRTHVGEGAIVYGYDLSSNAMVNRIHPPSIHVLTQKVDSPEILTLAGTRTDQRYNVIVYVTTRGTDYRNAYRLGASILGEVFDELYTKTGLEHGVDSLISYDSTLDSKVDEDEVVCVHVLNLTYMKKIRMFLREV